MATLRGRWLAAEQASDTLRQRLSQVVLSQIPALKKELAARGAANVALTKRVAEDLKVDEKQASFVIRDITIGEDYSFLMDAVRAHTSICPLLVVCRRFLTHYP